MKKIKQQTCKFVLGSDLFDGIDDLWNELSESSNITFGDSNRTMVTAERILDELEFSDNESLVAELKKRIEALPLGLQTYTDLEN